MIRIKKPANSLESGSIRTGLGSWKALLIFRLRNLRSVARSGSVASTNQAKAGLLLFMSGLTNPGVSYFLTITGADVANPYSILCLKHSPCCMPG